MERRTGKNEKMCRGQYTVVLGGVLCTIESSIYSLSHLHLLYVLAFPPTSNFPVFVIVK